MTARDEPPLVAVMDRLGPPVGRLADVRLAAATAADAGGEPGRATTAVQRSMRVGKAGRTHDK